MRRIVYAAMISAALMIPSIGAQTDPPERKEGRVQRRQENQQKRIAEGVENGQLTPNETANLENKEAKLNQEIRDDREDNGGKLTPKEKKQINRRQNKLSRQIYRAKHDGVNK